MKQNSRHSCIRLKECIFRLGSSRWGLWKGNSEVEAKMQVMNVIASKKVRAMTSGAKRLGLLSCLDDLSAEGCLGPKLSTWLTRERHAKLWTQLQSPRGQSMRGPLFYCSPFPQESWWLSWASEYSLSALLDAKSQEKGLFQQMGFPVTISKATIYLDFQIFLLYCLLTKKR